MTSSRTVLPLATAAVGAPCVLAVVAYGELSLGALVAVSATGVLLTVAGLLARAGRGAPPVGASGLPWLAWLAAAGGLELITLVVDDVPTLSDLLDVVLAFPAARAAAAVLWLLAGAWLLTRAARDPR